MPLDRYFSGHGGDVMSKMQEKYGDEGGKRVFYATVNKRKRENGIPVVNAEKPVKPHPFNRDRY